MRKEKKLYLRMPDQYIRKNLDDLCLGYANALESVGLILHGGETVRFRPWDDPDEEEEETE